MKKLMITMIALGGFMFAGIAQQTEKLPKDAPRVTRPPVKIDRVRPDLSEGGKEVLMESPSKVKIVPLSNSVHRRAMKKFVYPQNVHNAPEKISRK